MPLLPVITLRGVPPSDELMAELLDDVARFERCYEPILSCRVLVEFADEHDREGNPYHVRIDLDLPGAGIVVQHGASVPARTGLAREPLSRPREVRRERRSAKAAMRQACAMARRRLRDHARQRREAARTHAARPLLHAAAVVVH